MVIVVVVLVMIPVTYGEAIKRQEVQKAVPHDGAEGV
jgi:hypothetical protein